jgi:hypothetical protein
MTRNGKVKTYFCSQFAGLRLSGGVKFVNGMFTTSNEDQILRVETHRMFGNQIKCVSDPSMVPAATKGRVTRDTVTSASLQLGEGDTQPTIDALIPDSEK